MEPVQRKTTKLASLLELSLHASETEVVAGLAVRFDGAPWWRRSCTCAVIVWELLVESDSLPAETTEALRPREAGPRAGRSATAVPEQQLVSARCNYLDIGAEIRHAAAKLSSAVNCTHAPAK